MYGKNYDPFYCLRLYSFTFRLLPQLGNHKKNLTAVRRLEKVKLTSGSFKVIVTFS